MPHALDMNLALLYPQKGLEKHGQMPYSSSIIFASQFFSEIVMRVLMGN
jgi:hypothetical protein